MASCYVVGPTCESLTDVESAVIAMYEELSNFPSPDMIITHWDNVGVPSTIL